MGAEDRGEGGEIGGEEEEVGMEGGPGGERVGGDDLGLEGGEGGGELGEALAGLLEGFDVGGGEGGHCLISHTLSRCC